MVFKKGNQYGKRNNGKTAWNKIDVDIELMKKLYYEDKFDYKQIADYFGLKSKSGVYDRFKKLGLKARTNTDLKTGTKHSKETLKKISKAVKGRVGYWHGKKRLELTGKNNPMYGKRGWNYNGGYNRHDGYVSVWHTGRATVEHRMVMEKHLKRKLLPTEIVHHINRKKIR